MRARGRPRLVVRCAALALLVAAPAVGQDFKILYHENVPGFAAAQTAGASAAGSPGTAGKPAPALRPSWSFVAFGRQFDVELERNDRLVRSLPQERRDRLRDIELYSGSLAGLPGSWVRVTRHRNDVSGVIFDGTTLYGVETQGRVAAHIVSPGTGDADIAIYRWRDTTGVLRDEVVEPSGDSVAAAAASSSAAPSAAAASAAAPSVSDAERLALLSSPLPTPVGPGAQLDIAIVGDETFAQREGASAEATLLSMTNVIDGIYVMQIGIHLRIAELVVLDATGPFTELDARALLSELEDYKFSTPAFRSSGLAHLFTGRNLVESDGQSGQLVGMANLGVVCSERFGVALTQATLGMFSSALVAAHEIGHNFGAPHDAEAGSQCEDEPGTFLMAPSVSGSRAFSQCSIEQMGPEVASASCLAPLPATNLWIEVTQAPPAEVDQGEPFELAFAIHNTGAAAAQDVEVTIAFVDLDGPTFVETAGDSQSLEECSQGLPAYCRFPRLGPGETARYTLRFSALAGGPKTIDLNVGALNDTNASDNAASVTLDVRPFVDLVSEMEPAEVAVYADEPVRLSGTVRNIGLVAASGVVAELVSSYHYDITEIDAGGASCVRIEDGFVERFRCTLGGLAAGGARSIAWTARPKQQHADDLGLVNAGLNAYGAEPENGPVQSNNSASTRIVRTDAKAEVVTVIEAPSSFNLGRPVQLVARISNQGPDEARDMRVVYDAANALGRTVNSISSNVGQCTVAAAASDLECRIAQLAVGESLVITFNGTAESLGTYRLSVAGLTGSGDPNPQNNIGTHAFTVVDPAAPATSPLTPRSGGGGGSGAIGLGTLVGLLAAWVAAWVAAFALGAPLTATAQEPPDGERRQESGVQDAEPPARSPGIEPPPRSSGVEPPPRSSGVELPEGAGKALVQTSCMPCHDLAGIAAYKGYWNREQWAAMVATMIGHGAQLDAAEAEIVTDYLAAHFGVEEAQRQERGKTE